MNAKMCLSSVGVRVFSLTLLISKCKENRQYFDQKSCQKELIKNTSPDIPVPSKNCAISPCPFKIKFLLSGQIFGHCLFLNGSSILCWYLRNHADQKLKKK